MGALVGAALMLARTWCTANDAEVCRLNARVQLLALDIARLQAGLRGCSLKVEVP